MRLIFFFERMPDIDAYAICFFAYLILIHSICRYFCFIDSIPMPTFLPLFMPPAMQPALPTPNILPPYLPAA